MRPPTELQGLSHDATILEENQTLKTLVKELKEQSRRHFDLSKRLETQMKQLRKENQDFQQNFHSSIKQVSSMRHTMSLLLKQK